jgi:hypothetical protein
VADAKPTAKSDEPTVFDVNFVADCNDPIAPWNAERAPLSAPYAETFVCSALVFLSSAAIGWRSTVINCETIEFTSMFETPETEVAMKT